MDPTRRKEELSLREQIAKLRKEMAWSAAEDEVNAQKDALQKQIDSIDEYLEYVNNYYEELLENPRKLIEEMAWLMQSTNEEIVEWLKANHSEYANMSDAMRTDTVKGWESMLDDMRGYTETYWDEVERIIAGGDDAIIAFLKEHSAEYKEAGHLQAQAYVDQWKQKLEDLRSAYKKVWDEINSYDYAPIQPPSGDGGSGSGGSGGGGGKRYKFEVFGRVYGPYSTMAEAQMARELEAQRIKAIAPNGSSMYGQAIQAILSAKIVKYAKGGVADYTGPAWVDGSKAKPERILSPYQTVLFEDMISTLHDIRIKTPAIAAVPKMQPAPDRVFHIESIQVHVAKLDSETDYEELAQKVGEHLYDEIARGTPVGGFRLGRR